MIGVCRSVKDKQKRVKMRAAEIRTGKSMHKAFKIAPVPLLVGQRSLTSAKDIIYNDNYSRRCVLWGHSPHLVCWYSPIESKR
jgi:hypothetical protein